MSGDPVYFHFRTGDGERARSFFGELLGWEFAAGNVEEGTQITNVEPPGGFYASEESAEPGDFRVYFRVDDLEAAIARVRSLGGEAGEPQPTEAGHYADCSDDQGMRFGIWAPDA